MYCNHCGKEINDDAKFCPYCGFDRTSTMAINVKEVEEAEKKSETDAAKAFNDTVNSFKKIDIEDNSVLEKDKERKKGVPKALIIFLVIMLLIGSIGAFAFLNYQEIKYRFFPDKIEIFDDVYLSSFDYNWPENKREVTCSRSKGTYCELFLELNKYEHRYLASLLSSEKDKQAVMDSFDNYRKYDTLYNKYPFLNTDKDIMATLEKDSAFDDADAEILRNSIYKLPTSVSDQFNGRLLSYFAQMNKEDKLDRALATYALIESGYMLNSDNVRMYDSEGNEITDVKKLNDGDVITLKFKYKDVYSEDKVFGNELISRDAKKNKELFEKFNISGGVADYTENLNKVLDKISDYNDILKILGVRLEKPSIEIRYDKNKTVAGERAGIWKKTDGSFIVIEDDGSLYIKKDNNSAYGTNNRQQFGNIWDYYHTVDIDELVIKKGPFSGSYVRSDEKALNGSTAPNNSDNTNSSGNSGGGVNGDDALKEEILNCYNNTACDINVDNANVVNGKSSSNRNNLKEVQIFARNGVTYRYDYNNNQTTVENPIDEGFVGFLQLKKDNEIRIRNTHSTSGKIVGHVYEYAKVPYYDKKTSGGFNWYKIDKNSEYWLADDGTWCELFNYWFPKY